MAIKQKIVQVADTATLPSVQEGAPWIVRNPRRAFYIVAYLIFAIILGAGAYLSWMSSDLGAQRVGEFLKYMSAVGFTTLFAWFFAQSYAQRQFRNEIEEIIQPIRVAAADIQQALFSPKDGPEAYVRYFDRINSSNSQIENAIGRFGKLIGQPLTGLNDEVRRRVGENEALRQALYRLSEELDELEDVKDNRDPSALKERLSNVRAQVGEILGKVYVQETVNCPFCNMPTVVTIGEQSGESSSPTCDKCGERFMAHRKGSRVEPNRPGIGAAASRKIFANCASGKDCVQIPLSIVAGDMTPQIRFCGCCGAKNEIDPSTGSSKLISSPPIREGVARPNDGLACVDCDCGTEADWRFRLFKDRTLNGVCRRRDALVKMPDPKIAAVVQ